MDEAGDRPRRVFWPMRVVLATLMALAGINLFTGAPLLALWVGSRIEGGGTLTMGIIFAVIATLGVALALLAKALTALGRAYDSLTGRPRTARQRAPWLRSMRDEPAHTGANAGQLTMLEKVLMASVVVAVLGFEVWFFFFAGSSLPSNT